MKRDRRREDLENGVRSCAVRRSWSLQRFAITRIGLTTRALKTSVSITRARAGLYAAQAVSAHGARPDPKPNRFDMVTEGTRYTVEAEVGFNMPDALIAPFLRGVVQSQVRRFVLDPMRSATHIRFTND